MSTPLTMLLVLLAAVALVMLWRLVLTAGVIALLQWAIVSYADSTAVQLLTFAVPALLAAFVLVRLVPHHTNARAAHTDRPMVADLPGVAR